MEILTLKDVREILDKVPVDVLEKYGFAPWQESEAIELMCFGDDSEGEYGEDMEKYPDLEEINKWVHAIIKEHNKIQDQDLDDDFWLVEEPISSA